MSDKSYPTEKAIIEEEKNHSEGGPALDAAIGKKVKEVKDRSLVEKKRGSPRYRKSMEWTGLNSQEDADKKYAAVIEAYRSGDFFLERIGRYAEVDSPLAFTVMHLRSEWIEQYDIKTAPEFMILDMAMTSYFHFLRTNEEVNNIMANIEWDIFALDAPAFKNGVGNFFEDEKRKEFIAEGLAHRLQKVLQPTLDQFNRMFIRNLKAIRDLKRGNVQLNIGHVGQMNVGDKQINVGTKSDPAASGCSD
jgi:hypothetical protein